MELLRFLPFIILLFFLLKFSISFFQKLQASINNKLDTSLIENGIISIKDIQKNNYNRFIDLIKFYLESSGFTNISLLTNNESDLTDLLANLNNEEVYISCIQNNLLENEPFLEENINTVDITDIEKFIGRITCTNCTKGILITNTAFSKSCIKFIDTFNSNKDNVQINLIDGYELTKATRNYRIFFNKEGVSYDK